MKHARLRNALLSLSLALLAILPARVLGQIDTGGITGTVHDPTGAVVPNAQIKLTNQATGVTTQTTSTSTGTYALRNVRPGTYTITGEAPGFDTFTETNLVIHVQAVLTVDMPLATGRQRTQITVTAAAPLLQAENASVGQTINTQTVNDMPLQTRDWVSLAQLSAGVSTAPVGQPSGDSGRSDSAYFSVDGVNLWQNDFRLNGINDNIEFYGGSSVGNNAAIVPPPDAIEEFKIQNGDFNAEFGHSTGGVVNAVIKSGTNHFHGDAWEYWRNDVLNANLFFNELSHTPKPEYRQNLFGGTLGGPIFRNKTFFFVDYQGGRYITPSPATSTVPTQSMINSRFTNLQDLIAGNSGVGTDALGRRFPHGTILDPSTTREIAPGGVDPITGLINTQAAAQYVRDPFYTGGSIVGKTDYTSNVAQLNIIPAGRLDPNAVKLLGVYPAPTGPGLINNYFISPKLSENTNSYDIRIDENFNDKNYLFGVYSRSLNSQSVPAALPGLAVGESGGRNDSFPAWAVATGYTRVLTPTLTNEVHFGIVHSDKLQRSIFGDTFGIPAQFGIGGVQQVANNGGLPPTTINGLTHIGVGNYTPTLQYVYSIEGADAVTKLYHNHAFKTGVQLDDLEGNISQPPQGRGDFNFNGQYTDIPNLNNNTNGIGDLLLTPTPSTVGGPAYVGGMSSFSGSNIAATDDHRWYIGAYFQDDWKITPDLTLNLGLRWDYFSPYSEIHGRQANFIAAGGNGNTGTYYVPKAGCSVPRSTGFDALLAASNITLNCTSSTTLGTAQKTNFAPRLGFAYRVNPTLVVRGGFGITYGALGNLGYGGTLGTNYPFVYVDTFNSPDSQHPLVLSNGAPAVMEQAFTTVNLQDPTQNSGTGLNLYGRQYNFQTPYVQTINLTVQDQFTAHDSLQVGYVGTLGRHLDNLGYNNSPTQILPPSVNPQLYVPFPKFNRNATYETTNASSSYNSMQVTYEHELSSGLYLLGNYTWSKCMSDQHTQASQNQQYRAEWLPGFGIQQDYGLCDTDATNLVHVSGTYNLPFGRGREFMANSGALADAFLGGWILNGIYSYQTGQPFTVTCPVATTSGFGCFANKVSGQSLYAGPHNYTQWLNPAAFAQPPVATSISQGDFAVLGGAPQQARGPHFTNLDASFLKDFTVTESTYVQFRAEAFNTLNNVQLGQPTQLNFNTENFSQITTQRNPNRVMQLALKLFF